MLVDFGWGAGRNPPYVFCFSAAVSPPAFSPPSSSLFFLIWLASLLPALSNWLDRFAPTLKIWPLKMLSCSLRLGHLLTALTCSAASDWPSITPPLGANGAKFLS